MEVKYDKIGVGYNETRKPDKYITNRLIYHLNPKSERIYLDIGCGTGNYTNELQKKGLNLIGIDPSKEMLEKAIKRNGKIDWRIGIAENSGLSDRAVDGILATLTMHHWQDLKLAFKELHRILKRKGTLVIFTSTPKQMKGYWLNYYFPKMMKASIHQMPSLRNVKEALLYSEFSLIETDPYFVRPDLQDLFLYAGKHDPKLYLNPLVRKGISSFSSLANKAEVERGLTALKKDIHDGKIKEVMKSYENNLGDYLFITAKKIPKS